MNTAKKLTTREQIRKAFVTNDNRWLSSHDLLAVVDAATQTVYSTISNMATANPPQVERQNCDAGYEYRIPPLMFEQIKKEFAEKVAAKFETPAPATPTPEPVATETPDMFTPPQQEEKQEEAQEQKEESQQAEPQVTQVPEGQKTRQKMWRAEDQRLFCLAYLDARDANPLHGFESLANMAQKVLPVEKRKVELKYRTQIPWFEREIEVVKIEHDKMKRERAEEEARKQREEEARALAESAAQEKLSLQANILQALHGAGNDMLIAELMRRGQSLIETMLINAMQSPKVQHAFASTIFGGNSVERRNHSRQTYEAPEQAQRVRLEKIGIVGINKPIHQNQMKQRLADMFELRFGNVDGTPAQLTATMGGCDLVIGLTDHIPHRTRSQLKAANIEWMPLSGDKRAAEEFLSKRYLEKDNTSK
jgi:hypothetical protein